ALIGLGQPEPLEQDELLQVSRWPSIMPAQAGIQPDGTLRTWIPAFAGMTCRETKNPRPVNYFTPSQI
ncbi:MAG: hypothetical protein M0036_21905, partial [Desulfobacteraceae bacterium]|nr:hypothetical protein [Desulfobacteraceae bacterium]